MNETMTPGYTVPDPNGLPRDPHGGLDATPSPTAPAANPPRWSGKKTAIAAALAIGFASAGTVAAASNLPAGSGGGTVGPGGRGQFLQRAPGGQPGQQGQQGQQGQFGQQGQGDH